LSADGFIGAIDFTYDNIGNRLTRTVDGQVDTYTYQPGTGRLAQITEANPAAFSYDASGNIIDIDIRVLIRKNSGIQLYRKMPAIRGKNLLPRACPTRIGLGERWLRFG